MASTDARPVPRKNTAFRHYFAIRKNDGTLITTWAGADSEVSIDGAAFADCTSEATEIGTSGCGYIDLTAAEMNGDAVVLKTTVTNTDALPVVITFFPEEVGDYRANTVQIEGTDATDALATAVSGLATAANLATLATYVDTEVAAIKTQTDSLPTSFGGITTSLTAITNLIDTEVAAIKTVTDKVDDTLEDDGGTFRFTATALAEAPTGGSAPTAVEIRQEMDANSTKLAAIKLQTDLLIAFDSGTVSASPAPTTTTFTATGASLNTTAGFYTTPKPMFLQFTGGSLAGRSAKISGHSVSGSNHAFTLATALPSAPSSSDTFIILGYSDQ